MNFRFMSLLCAAIVAIGISVGVVETNELIVGDAYARGSADGLVWTIGTGTVQMSFDCRDGKFRLVSFLNKVCEPSLEYVDSRVAAAPFVLNSEGISRKPEEVKPVSETDSPWTLKTGAVRQVASGGRPAVQLDFDPEPE